MSQNNLEPARSRQSATHDLSLGQTGQVVRPLVGTQIRDLEGPPRAICSANPSDSPQPHRHTAPLHHGAPLARLLLHAARIEGVERIQHHSQLLGLVSHPKGGYGAKGQTVQSWVKESYQALQKSHGVGLLLFVPWSWWM